MEGVKVKMTEIKKIINDERGATLLEYAGLAVLILVGIWVAATQLAGGVNERFEDIQDRIEP